MGCSRQNIKKLALTPEKKGDIERAEKYAEKSG